jgi:hypothetical protein
VRLPYISLLAGLLSSGVFAGSIPVNDSLTSHKIAMSGYGYFMFGQVVSGSYFDGDIGDNSSFQHLWSHICLQHLNVHANPTEWFSTNLGVELYVGFARRSCCAMNKNSYFRDYQVYLAEVEGIMHWNFDRPVLRSLKIRTGLLPYTINSEVKTLGNYLFRSTIHPVSVQNRVDYPWADLLGGVAEVGLLKDRLTIEAIIASEFRYVPLFDFTPAFGLYGKPTDAIDIGGAIAFYHAIQASCGLMADTIGKHWQGTKINARMIFDPKPLFDGINFLGKEELRMYGEIGFLGLKDTLEVDTSNFAGMRSSDPDTATLRELVFPANSLIHRMPFMIGFNLPTWKILDLLSVELEWFYSPYANDWFGLSDSEKPVARPANSLKQWNAYLYEDNFKWAVHCRKSVGNFEVRAFVGSDHTVNQLSVPTSPYTHPFEQNMKRKGDWQWFIQLRYNL